VENKLTADKFERLDFPGGSFFRANQKHFPALRGLAIQMLTQRQIKP
jgi:hypothetical protein